MCAGYFSQEIYWRNETEPFVSIVETRVESDERLQTLLFVFYLCHGLNECIIL